uniref:Uncharacterized protein n=1 Tax=Salvator merianae TaxID=96440 RepID=A0A8D0BVI0_SALMN
VAPLSVVHFLDTGPHLDATRAHVEQQVQVAVQEFHGEVVGLVQTLGAPLFRWLQAPVTEEQQPIRFCGAEVEGDGPCLLGVPFGQRDVRLGGFKGDRVKGCHVFAAEDKVAVDLHLGVTFFGKARQF